MASELSGFCYQDEISFNDYAGVFIRNALVTNMPALFRALRLFNRQDCYLPVGICIALHYWYFAEFC